VAHGAPTEAILTFAPFPSHPTKPRYSTTDQVIFQLSGTHEWILEAPSAGVMLTLSPPPAELTAAQKSLPTVQWGRVLQAIRVAGIDALAWVEELVGRGGGNFEMTMPKNFILQKGDQVVLPGPYPYVLAIVEKIISDPRDLFTKALLVSPVNIQELKFVEVEQ